LLSKISYKLNLLDIPNKRSSHVKPTAYTGGIILSIIYLTSIKLFDIPYPKLNLILSLAFLISIVGLIDDYRNLNVGGKLSLQLIPIFYLIAIENISLNSLGNYEYFEIKLSSFSIPFSLLSIMLLINSFNYLDGLDGTLGSLTTSVLCILIFLIDNDSINQFLILILIPLLFFLCFNFSLLSLPKLFLGDNGSLMLGFIISFILIYTANQNLVHPILLAWSIVIFVYEFLSINILRLKLKKNLFMADKNHFHHILFKNTNSIFLTNTIIFLTNVSLFIIGYFSFYLISPIVSLILFIILFFIFYFFRNKIYYKS
jgi:UDP-GlcNAc:undecaprenyl-phosphate GlcNAc-1-phosphate transferase